MKDKAFEKILKISEEFFGTTADPDQMPISQDSANKLYSIHPDTVMYLFDNNDNPIAWATTIPTSQKSMNAFLHKEITERELLERAVLEKSFESLYLCAVFVLPEYRRKGYAKELCKKSIGILSQGNNPTLYSWAYSEEGRKLIEFMEADLGKKILLREE